MARTTGAGIANARLANNPLVLGVRRDLLLFQQGHLAFNSPAVSGNTPVPAQDSVTGDDHRQSIRSNRAPNGAHRFRCADVFGDLRITRGRANGDLAESLPDAALENGSA